LIMFMCIVSIITIMITGFLMLFSSLSLMGKRPEEVIIEFCWKE
jgi:hypothetical protein